jgi:hypothetical protein
MNVVMHLLLVGGLLMLAGTFLPWAQASFMGMVQPVFNAWDIRSHQMALNLLPVGGVVSAVVGLAGTIPSLKRRPRSLRYLGFGAFLFGLVPAAVILWTLARLHTSGLSLGWVEGATAADLELSYRAGLPAALCGCALAMAGGLLLASKRTVD